MNQYYIFQGVARRNVTKDNLMDLPRCVVAKSPNFP